VEYLAASGNGKEHPAEEMARSVSAPPRPRTTRVLLPYPQRMAWLCGRQSTSGRRYSNIESDQIAGVYEGKVRVRSRDDEKAMKALESWKIGSSPSEVTA
jgi:hypothetical protein